MDASFGDRQQMLSTQVRGSRGRGSDAKSYGSDRPDLLQKTRQQSESNRSNTKPLKIVQIDLCSLSGSKHHKSPGRQLTASEFK